MNSSKTRDKSNKKTDSSSDDILRVLCLHGYRQNGDIFKSKIGSFRKRVQKYAEFVFITAPHEVNIPNDSMISENGAISSDDSEKRRTERSWWFNKEDGTFKGSNQNGPAFGFDESVHLVEEAWQTLGPFHGILGFSQGACFAGLICSLSARGLTVINPEFAIIAAGFRSGSLAHMNYYEDLISIPSMHIAGTTDNIIHSEMSMALSVCFEDPTIVLHPGGHYFAATAVEKDSYTEFFRKRLIEHLERKEFQKDDAVVIVDPLDGIPSTSAASADISDDSD